MTVLESKGNRRRDGKSARTKPQRPDIQGLRMVAVLLVVSDHLFGWPTGGFIGVDVFFVISGFLITGSLLHTYEKTNRISFSSFYRRRIRRIVPAATLVLVVTMVAAYLVFNVARAKATGLDAVAAFFFVSNWRFAIEGTDYFSSTAGVSPLQHYWSLSVEEQFYFVWPAVILAIAVIVAARSGSRRARLGLSAATMGVIVIGSFIYAVMNTSSDPTWAYFSTFARVWELGVGALLAITLAYFERIPAWMRPIVAWVGLLAIVLGAFSISETGSGFPAPWAAVPVLGSALVIAAGVGGSHRFLQVLTNRVSTYVGDISYSLYLWHWPVIVILGVLIDTSVYYYVGALAFMFALAIGSYTFFENPIRESGWLSTSSERAENKLLRKSRWRLEPKKLSRTNQIFGTLVLALATAGLAAVALQPISPPSEPPVRAQAVTSVVGEGAAPNIDLAAEINAAVGAETWPSLDPTMDEAIEGKQAPADILPCGAVKRLPAERCTWGDPDADRTIMLVGDSVAMTYVEPLKNFVLASNGQWNLRGEAMFGCRFVDITFKDDNAFNKACPDRKADAVEAINQTRPDVVIIANGYGNTDSVEWENGLARLTSQFAANVGRVVLLAAPPTGIKPAECYNRASSPADCLVTVSDAWIERAAAEERAAATIGGTFIDSREWFCTADRFCPSFVGTTPVRSDATHMTPEYADLMSPAFAASLQRSGLFA